MGEDGDEREGGGEDEEREGGEDRKFKINYKIHVIFCGVEKFVKMPNKQILNGKLPSVSQIGKTNPLSCVYGLN